MQWVIYLKSLKLCKVIPGKWLQYLCQHTKSQLWPLFLDISALNFSSLSKKKITLICASHTRIDPNTLCILCPTRKLK